MEFQGAWENLIYDTDIKSELVRFVSTSLLLSDRGVDAGIVTCNRVVLLHGPPGTGKVSSSYHHSSTFYRAKHFSFRQVFAKLWRRSFPSDWRTVTGQPISSR